jgi:hypothetical protein
MTTAQAAKAAHNFSRLEYDFAQVAEVRHVWQDILSPYVVSFLNRGGSMFIQCWTAEDALSQWEKLVLNPADSSWQAVILHHDGKRLAHAFSDFAFIV